MRYFGFLMLLCAALLVASCAANRAKTSGEAQLADGIRDYEQANYPAAASHFHNALELHLKSKSSQIKAHKYLAFIHCSYAREALCGSEFRKVLELDPHFDLEPGEAGHPLWGPVFRKVKAEKASAARGK